MTVTLINPAALPQPDVYAQVAVGEGTRTVYLAGQVARAADGSPVATGDLAGQVEQAYRNVAAALAAADATFDDVVHLRVYVVDWSSEKFADLAEGAGRVFADLGLTHTPPITLIGAAALGEPDLLVEVEAVAVV